MRFTLEARQLAYLGIQDVNIETSPGLNIAAGPPPKTLATQELENRVFFQCDALCTRKHGLPSRGSECATRFAFGAETTARNIAAI